MSQSVELAISAITETKEREDERWVRHKVCVKRWGQRRERRQEKEQCTHHRRATFYKVVLQLSKGCLLFFKIVCISYQFKDYAVNGQTETCKDIVCTLQRKFPGKTSEWRFCRIMWTCKTRLSCRFSVCLRFLFLSSPPPCDPVLPHCCTHHYVSHWDPLQTRPREYTWKHTHAIHPPANIQTNVHTRRHLLLEGWL